MAMVQEALKIKLRIEHIVAVLNTLRVRVPNNHILS